MVMFNDPLPCDDPRRRVRLAIAMRARMVEFCARWKTTGPPAWVRCRRVVRLCDGGNGRLRRAVRLHGFRHGGQPRLAALRRGRGWRNPAEPAGLCGGGRPVVVESRGEFTLKGIREPAEVFRLTGITAA